jgi:hypothetical protein
LRYETIHYGERLAFIAVGGRGARQTARSEPRLLKRVVTFKLSGTSELVPFPRSFPTRVFSQLLSPFSCSWLFSVEVHRFYGEVPVGVEDFEAALLFAGVGFLVGK